MKGKPQIMIFGSHNPRPGEGDYEKAVELGRLLAAAGFEVASGGYGGFMEAVLKGAVEGGGRGIGYTCSIFRSEANRYVGKEVVSGSLLNRMGRMIADSDGFVVLRGGTGTLSELAVAWEFINKKMVAYKPLVFLGDFWRPVVDTLRVEPSIENISTLRPENRSATDFIRFANEPAEAVGILKEELENAS